MINDIRIISLDLDGTLLNFRKEVSERNMKALEMAAKHGIVVVPTTGRLAEGLPKALKELPFIRYVIGANGAVVTDRETGEDLMKAEIPCDEVLKICDIAKKYDVLYDCYINGTGYISQEMMDRVADYTIDEKHVELMKNTRHPVDNLDEFVRTNAYNALKIQFLFRSEAARDEILPQIKEDLAGYRVTNSYPNNIEINAEHANKGEALKFLCDYLGIPMVHAMSFGDGTNDVTMLDMAGIGVAMENADPAAFPHGKVIAPDCNDDGVARIIEEYIIGDDIDANGNPVQW